jgi:serine protease
MGNSTDKDYFKVALAASQSLKVDMTGPVGKDYDLYLVDASGNVLASSEGNTSTESVTYKNGTSAKTVYIEVVSYSGSSTTLQYTLKISHP